MKVYVSQKDTPGVWMLFEVGDTVVVSLTTEAPDRSKDLKISVLELAGKVEIAGPHQLIFR
ncbi:MAG: hypothetical protein WDN47_04255 [Candidatus Doudnabacteria bacterium]